MAERNSGDRARLRSTNRRAGVSRLPRVGWCVIAAGGLALTACSTPPPPAPSAAGPEKGYSGPSGLVAYVANTYDQGQGFIQAVCLDNGKLGPRVPVGGQPFTIAVTPDGRTAYVANSGWDGPKAQSTITPVDLATQRPAPAIPAGLGPMGIAITPDGTRAYVADMGSFLNNQTSSMIDANTVTPIDLINQRPMKPIVVGPGVGAISITPDGKRALVAIDGTDRHPQSYVEILDLATGHLGAPIGVGAAPMAIAITPDGSRALVTDTGFRPLGHLVTPINLRTNRAGRSIPVGTGPIDIVLTPNGKRAFVANTLTDDGNSFSSQGTVSSIALGGHTPSHAITVPGVPQALAITPGGRTVYEVGLEANQRSALAPIDVATGRVGPAIQFHTNLGEVAVTKAPRGLCGSTPG